MGMTIEESKEEINIMLTQTKDLGFHEAVRTLLDKYQKIEKVYSEFLDDVDVFKLADKLGEIM